MSADPRVELRREYEEAARRYLARLPLEHFMEATPQATQREISVASLALIGVRRPDVQHFNELLIQDAKKGKRGKVQVVPDNMVVVHSEPIEAVGSYDIPLQPVGPLVVMEYVSKSSKRKDYEDSFSKYERRLKVPYYLVFYPEAQELTLYKHNGKKYVSVQPNEHGRFPIPELETEVAVHDGWMRYWFRGELVPLPADMLRQLEATRQEMLEAQRRADEAERRAEEAERRAEAERQARAEADQRAAAAAEELAQLRAELERLRSQQP
jgi:Uma2 family endonuclease